MLGVRMKELGDLDRARLIAEVEQLEKFLVEHSPWIQQFCGPHEGGQSWNRTRDHSNSLFERREIFYSVTFDVHGHSAHDNV